VDAPAQSERGVVVLVGRDTSRRAGLGGLALATLVGSLCAGCSLDPGPPYRARVLTLEQFDRATERGVVALADRDLPHLSDLDALRGPEIVVYRGGAMTVRTYAGSVVYQGQFDHGAKAEPRYAIERGVVVPLDYPSLIMLSVHHDFGRILDALLVATGVSVAELLGAARIEAFFEPVIRVASETADVTVSLRLNAFNLLGTRQFGLAERSPLEQAPLAANRAVLAHELGHALFTYLFAGSETLECAALGAGRSVGQWLSEYTVAGFNEGFADFLAFTVTGVTNVLFDLPRIDAGERSLTRATFGWSGLADDCQGGLYCVGSLLARSLYEALLELGYDPDDADSRGAFARGVFTALAHTRAGLARLGADVLPPPSWTVSACAIDDALHPVDDGRIAGAFLGILAEAMPPEQRAAVCRAFVRNFGEEGFPVVARGVCGDVP